MFVVFCCAPAGGVCVVEELVHVFVPVFVVEVDCVVVVVVAVVAVVDCAPVVGGVCVLLVVAPVVVEGFAVEVVLPLHLPPDSTTL